MRNMRQRTVSVRGITGVAAAFSVAALAIGGSVGASVPDGSGGATADPPAPFDEGDIQIALVQQSGAGDYFQQWTSGAQEQAELLGVELQVYDAQADNARQATDMEAAMNSGVDGIIVDHGLADTMCPLIAEATDNGIPVVVYDIEITECAPDAVETAQSDADLATLVLGEMLEREGTDIRVGYVNVYGIAPLDRRDVVWQEFKEENSWEEAWFVGEYTNAVATDNAQLVNSALTGDSDISAIFAPYDELAKGAITAVLDHDLADQIGVYGIDISNADIEVMTADGSPWKATATTDPTAIGAGVMRTMALELAGEQDSREVVFPGVLITQDFLLENEIRNMDDLRAALPELDLAHVSSAAWIESLTFG